MESTWAQGRWEVRRTSLTGMRPVYGEQFDIFLTGKRPTQPEQPEYWHPFEKLSSPLVGKCFHLF